MVRRCMTIAVLALLAGAASAAATSRVYMQIGHTLESMPTSGGPTRHLTRISGNDTGLAVGGGYVFWFTGDGEEGSLMRVGVDGSDPHAIVRHLKYADSAVVIGRRVYWLESSAISSARLDGTRVRHAQFGLPHDPQFTPTSAALGLATDGRFLYYARCSQHAIGRVFPFGKDRRPQFIVTGKRNSCPSSVAVGGGWVYWIEQNLGPARIGRARLDGMQVDDDWLRVPTGVIEMTAGAGYVFWTHLRTPSRELTDLARVRADGTGLIPAWGPTHQNIFLAVG